MTRSRFECLEVKPKGYRVAIIHDHTRDERVYAYFRQGRYRYWDIGHDDKPIRDRALRECAREALA